MAAKILIVEDECEIALVEQLSERQLAAVAEKSKGDVLFAVDITFKYKGEEKYVEQTGNGPIDAVKTAIEKTTGVTFRMTDYSQHALSDGSSAKAAAYVNCIDIATGKATYGVGQSTNITRASIRAIFSALNRLDKMTK